MTTLNLDTLKSLIEKLNDPMGEHHGKFSYVSATVCYNEDGTNSVVYVGHTNSIHSMLIISGFADDAGVYYFDGRLVDTRCLVYVDNLTPIDKAVSIYNNKSDDAKDVYILATMTIEDQPKLIYMSDGTQQ